MCNRFKDFLCSLTRGGLLDYCLVIIYSLKMHWNTHKTSGLKIFNIKYFDNAKSSEFSILDKELYVYHVLRSTSKNYRWYKFGCEL